MEAQMLLAQIQAQHVVATERISAAYADIKESRKFILQHILFNPQFVTLLYACPEQQKVVACKNK